MIRCTSIYDEGILRFLTAGKVLVAALAGQFMARFFRYSRDAFSCLAHPYANHCSKHPRFDLAQMMFMDWECQDVEATLTANVTVRSNARDGDSLPLTVDCTTITQHALRNPDPARAHAGTD